MPGPASRRARWTRQELLAWILHRRNSAVDEVAEIEAERGARLLPSMEAGITDYWATFARRGSGEIPTPESVLEAHALLEHAEASGEIIADEKGVYPSKVARKLWKAHKPGKAPVMLFSGVKVYRLAAAIQEHPKSHYTPKHEIHGNEDSARRNILKECGITTRKRSEIGSLFQAAIRLALKDLRDRQGAKTPEGLGEKSTRLSDGSILHPSVSMRPSPLEPKEHKRRSQNIETWTAKGRPHTRPKRRYLVPAAGTSKYPSV
jgi:hypothetical protein